MGFFSRLPVPRGMRRAMHPGQAATPAAAPEAVEVAHHAPRAADNGHSVRHPMATTAQAEANGKAGVWRHGDCPVNHRSAEAAAKCRNR
jgi:hypothetical protein